MARGRSLAAEALALLRGRPGALAAVAEILAARIAGSPDEGRRAAGQWTGRASLRPVAMDALAGRFGYEDIPMPPSAPS